MSPEIPPGAAFGVSILRGDGAAIVEVLRTDYEYLVRDPGFIDGHLLESTAEPGLFFHVTRWKSQQAFAAARDDAEIARILGALPEGALVSSHPSIARVVARDGLVEERLSGVGAQ
jgi:heme-degrading monooxygenase HmoA